MEAIDRLDEIQTCYTAIGDLMCSDGDLQEPQRDRIAVLMDFLNREHQKARDNLPAH